MMSGGWFHFRVMDCFCKLFDYNQHHQNNQICKLHLPNVTAVRIHILFFHCSFFGFFRLLLFLHMLQFFQYWMNSFLFCNIFYFPVYSDGHIPWYEKIQDWFLAYHWRATWKRWTGKFEKIQQLLLNLGTYIGWIWNFLNLSSQHSNKVIMCFPKLMKSNYSLQLFTMVDSFFCFRSTFLALLTNNGC